MALAKKNDSIVASFPVGEQDEIIMMTDGGQLMRCGVNEVRIVGRSTQGVRLIRVGEGESVVSVALVRDENNEEGEEEGSSDGLASEEALSGEGSAGVNRDAESPDRLEV